MGKEHVIRYAPKENYHLESHSKGFGVLEEFHEIKKSSPALSRSASGDGLGDKRDDKSIVRTHRTCNIRHGKNHSANSKPQQLSARLLRSRTVL